MQLCFLHGLDSSPYGTKARLLRSEYPHCLIPALPKDIHERLQILEKEIQTPLLTVGSSLGGLTALMFADPDEEESDAVAEISTTTEDTSAVAATPVFTNTATISNALPAIGEDGLDLKEHIAQMEIELIKQALSATHGVVAHAAELLKMRRTTLVEKLKKYGING